MDFHRPTHQRSPNRLQRCTPSCFYI
jgi:hypothetical protein